MSNFSVIVSLILTALPLLITGSPMKCETGQFLNGSSGCQSCHVLCSSCTSFGVYVEETSCVCKYSVYKNSTSIICVPECTSLDPSCVKAEDFDFQNLTTSDLPVKAADDAKWLLLLVAILACCCFCCAS